MANLLKKKMTKLVLKDEPKIATKRVSECLICHKFRENKINCNECDSYFCTSCIQDWKNKQNVGPLCKKNFPESRIAVREKQCVNSTLFACQKCKEKYIQKYKVCNCCITCPTYCKSPKLFRRILDLERHLEVECTEIDKTQKKKISVKQLMQTNQLKISPYSSNKQPGFVPLFSTVCSMSTQQINENKLSKIGGWTDDYGVFNLTFTFAQNVISPPHGTYEIKFEHMKRHEYAVPAEIQVKRIEFGCSYGYLNSVTVVDQKLNEIAQIRGKCPFESTKSIELNQNQIIVAARIETDGGWCLVNIQALLFENSN